MKYYILTSIFCFSTYSIVAMKLEPSNKKTNNSEYFQLACVKAANQGKPSINIINNDTYPLLHVSIGNFQKNGAVYSFPIYKNDQMTLCPYLNPDSLNVKQKKDTAITLSLYTNRLYCFIPYKNGNPTIRIHRGNFVDIPEYDYLIHKKKYYLIHNKEAIADGIRLTVVELSKKNTTDYTLQIGNNSPIQFGDTIRIDYSKKHKIRIIRNDTETVKKFPVTNHTLKLKNF